jgi:hypothetical protein
LTPSNGRPIGNADIVRFEPTAHRQTGLGPDPPGLVGLRTEPYRIYSNLRTTNITLCDGIRWEREEGVDEPIIDFKSTRGSGQSS